MDSFHVYYISFLQALVTTILYNHSLLFCHPSFPKRPVISYGGKAEAILYVSDSDSDSDVDAASDDNCCTGDEDDF